MNLHHFILVGINYKKTDTYTRSLFALNEDNCKALIEDAKKKGIKELLVLSTCNRTEIFAFSYDTNVLIDLIVTHSKGTIEIFKEKSYIKKNKEAIQHFFEVGAGLDSQILGDYEIIGQLKIAFKLSKKLQVMGTNLERLYNTVLQAAKAIKNNTSLSSGTVSVSFATIQYILQNLPYPSEKKYLLIGLGKIGLNTYKNLLDYIQPKEICVINRTEEKLNQITKTWPVKFAPFTDLEICVQEADIIIVATNAPNYIITSEQLKNCGKKYLFDLSIPNNVDQNLTNSGHSVINVDDLSSINDATLQKRKEQVPIALDIIKEHAKEFYDWIHLRKYAPILKTLKANLFALNMNETKEIYYKETIEKKINQTASMIRNNSHSDCFYMKVIKDFTQ